MGSSELAGCELDITDTEGNVIVSWTSGDEKSIQLSKKLGELGYRNVMAFLNEDGLLQIKGLFRDTTYTLTERRPADGYVTADSISFQLIEGENSKTLVAVFVDEELIIHEDNVVRMVDETTKFKLIKLAEDTGECLPGARFEVYDSEDNKVLEFTSAVDGYDITGTLVAGETYTFKEVEAPKGYRLASPVEYTIKDTPKLQRLEIMDKKQPHPGTPQTGGISPFAVSLLTFLFIFGGGAFIMLRRKRL